MKWAILVAMLSVSFLASASTFTTTVTFNEYPFPTATTNLSNTTTQYNLLNDATGSLLGSNNGDANDLSVQHTRSGPGSSSVEWNSTSTGRFTSNRSFSGTPTGGLAITSSVLLFGSQFQITDLTATFLSLNTQGRAWEYSILGFLDANGNPFSPAPSVSSYATYSGFSGSPSAGWFVAASRNTITGVGTPSNGPNDDLVLTYALAGLAPGTRIGGLVWHSYLEDIRTANTTTSFTSSLTQFTISGSVNPPAPVPEPSTWAMGAIALAGFLIIYRR